MSKAQNAPETGQLVAEMSDADLAKLLLQIREAEDGFLGFVKLMHPEWDIPDYQLEFIDMLDKLERRELLNKNGDPVYNLLVNMPPRHNKSTLATKLFNLESGTALCKELPVWVLPVGPIVGKKAEAGPAD